MAVLLCCLLIRLKSFLVLVPSAENYAHLWRQRYFYNWLTCVLLTDHYHQYWLTSSHNRQALPQQHKVSGALHGYTAASISHCLFHGSLVQVGMVQTSLCDAE